MKKALEILKREYPLICDMSFEWGWKSCEEAMKPKTCQECKWWDRTRPRSHPNYAECNNRNCPISYEEVIYTFGCNMYEPKDNA